jgi:hypothetical protein
MLFPDSLTSPSEKGRVGVTFKLIENIFRFDGSNLKAMITKTIELLSRSISADSIELELDSRENLELVSKKRTRLVKNANRSNILYLLAIWL